MKRIFITLGLFLFSMCSFGQTASNYTFTAIQGNYISLSGVPGVTDTSLAATDDDALSTAITLPFAFTFAGTAYNSIKVSSNGWLSFATGAITDSNDNTEVNAVARKPILFPLWDNLKCTVKPRYITTGIAPHRRFKVEWSQQSWDNGAAGNVISFQVWLFETTNVVEFLYSQGAVAVNNTSSGASIGICDAASNYLSLSDATGNPSAESSVFTTNIGDKPASGQVYRFTPPPTVGLEANKYCFAPFTRTYEELLSTTNFTGISATTDDGYSDVVPLPFTFNFGGTYYANLRVSSNGWVTFGSSTPTATQNNTNSSANANTIKPVLLPLWDNLRCAEIPKYVVSGFAPNRIFKIEWSKQRWNNTSVNDVISMQVWLYEKSNIIEYHYKQGTGAINSASATIGIYDAGGRYLTLNNSGASPTASSSTFTTSINTKPATHQGYRFSPPPVIAYPGNAFIAIGRVGVTQTGSTGGTYSATPTGLSFVSTATGEVNLSASAGGTYTITYTVGGCVNATTEMTIFSLLPQPVGTVTVASCSNGTDGAITVTNMNNDVKFIAADNDYIDLGSPLLSNRSAFTLEGWIKFNISDITGRTSLFGQNNVIEFGFLNSTTIECWTAARGSAYATLPASLGNNQWHHIAATGDGSLVRIYIDGISVTVTGGSGSTSNYGSSTAYTAKIGSKVYGDGTGETFPGHILKVGFYSTALSASRITSLAFGPTTYSGVEAGIIAGYNFFDGAGTTLTSTPAGNNGSFVNSPEWNDPYSYYWQKVSDGSFVGSTKSLTGLSPDDYKVTVGLIGVLSPNSKIFTVGSASDVVAIAGSGANCTTTINANWNASGGAVSYSLDVATNATFTAFVTGFNNLNVGNVTTYAVTNVPPGPVYYRVRKNSSCGVSANSNTITYQTLQINPPVAIAQTNLLCNGFTANWNVVDGASTYYLDVATDTGFTAFVTGYNNLNVGNVTSWDVVGLTSGINYYYRLRSESTSCGIVATPSNTISVLINVGPTTPIVGTITQATCAAPLASVVLSGLPAGDWILQFLSGQTYSGSGTSVTISNLAPGNTYNIAVSEGVCFSSYSANIVINPLVVTTSTWSGSSWSSAPSINNYIVFDGNYSSSGDVSGCTCTVNSGVTVTVNSGDTFTITNSVTTTGGTLIFENNASLVQTNDVNNTGNIIYKRISKPMVNFDYSYWSSPVGGQVFNVLSPNTLPDKYFSYDSVADYWSEESPTGTMTTGKGYIIRTPKAGLWGNGENVVFPYSQPVEFIGIPNNGGVFGESITALTSNRSFLIGNPYPSALDADLFLSANSAILEGTIYLWTHNTPIAQSGSFYVYTSNDYATYNTTGGATTGPANNSGFNNETPLGKIAAGQSFFATAKGVGTIAFTNAMRVSGNNSQFFKPGKSNETTALERHRLWLDMTNSGGAFKQTLIGYIEGATNNFEDRFDGVSFDGNSYIDFYSINNTAKLTIQGRALPFDSADVVPLGYKTSIAGNFTISINKTDGTLSNKSIYIEDKLTNLTHNLSLSNYTFTTTTGVFNDRFVLKYTNKTLGTDDFETKEEAVLVSVQNKTITINSKLDNIDKVFIYDITGKLLHVKQDVENPQLILQNLPFAQQVLLVKIVLTNDSETTKKIVFN